jgi:hypothetical protein
MTAAATLTDVNFLNATSIETVRLTGASSITLGSNAANAGVVNVSTGSGATSITGTNGVPLNVDATALANNTMLTLVGSSAEAVSGLIGDINAGSLTGPLTVTIRDATDNTITITTGSAATLITDNFSSDTVTVKAAALAQNTVLTLAGLAAGTVTGLVGDINAGSLNGALSVTTGNAIDNGIAITTGTGATLISASGASDVVTVDATALAENAALTLVGSAAEIVTGLVSNINAGTLTGTLSVTTGDATDDGIAITTGSAASSITDNFSSDTVTVNATALAQNTVLTLSGSAAEIVTGLVGDINAGSLTGTLSVTTGNANDNGITITTGSGVTSISASGASDVVTVNATALAENSTLTLSGSAAETVTGLVGDLNGGSLIGALSVTTGDASDNGIAITTGSAATSITAMGSNDTLTINATALATVGSGNNTIIGGSGADVLTGGSGADRFVFNATSDSIASAKDSINNFVHGVDIIDTSAISGVTAIQGLVSGTDQIAANSIAWVQNGADTLVYFNSSNVAENQSGTDMAIVLKSIAASVLTGTDFIHA